MLCAKVDHCYADDTLVFLSDIKSIEALFRLLDKFGKASEAKLNVDKSKLMLTGTLRNEVIQNCELKKEKKLKILGIWVGDGHTEVKDDNWDKVCDKINNTLNVWKARNLSIFGRAIIVNTLALSKLWYITQVEIPEKEVIVKIEKLVRDFIWYKKKQLVSDEKCKLKRSDGGLGLFDITAKAKTMRVKWLWNIYGQDKRESKDWEILGRFFVDKCNQSVGNIRTTCIDMNLRAKDTMCPHFYYDLIETWKTLKFVRRPLENKTQVLNEYLWTNPLINHGIEITNNVKWILGGIYCIKDIWSETKKDWLNIEQLRLKLGLTNKQYGLDKNLAKNYESIKAAIPIQWQGLIRYNKDESVFLDNLFIVEHSILNSKSLYEKYRSESQKNNLLPSWTNEASEVAVNLINFFFEQLKYSDIDNTIKELLWKIYNRGLPLGILTKDWFEDESGFCKLCNQDEIETFDHLFRSCVTTKRFQGWINDLLGLHNEPSDVNVQTYLNNVEKVANYGLFLVRALMKKTIWNHRNLIIFEQKIFSFNNLKGEFKGRFRDLMSKVFKIYQKNGQIENFRKK